MKIRNALIAAASVCGLFFTVQSGFAQGSLTPPGAPAATMVTLSQMNARLEPRTPISSLPYSITNPGSYYVTTNLTGASGFDGIDIKTNEVTLDLNGFTLQGVAGSGSGIDVVYPARNLAIRNGALDSWAGNGVSAANGVNSQFERLRVSNSGSGLFAGSNCVVLVCIASSNSNGGIFVGNNCTVKDCIAPGNSSGGETTGISVGNNCAVNDCTANADGYLGIGAGNNCTVMACTTSANSGYGIIVGNNCTVIACNASGNNGEMFDGITVGNNCTVKDCTASGNSGSGADGIYIQGNACLITGNTCSGNTQYGIEIDGAQNRIDGNVVGNNTSYGIYPDSLNVTNNITRNFSPGIGYGNTSGNNDYAPIGKPNTATNPWENF